MQLFKNFFNDESGAVTVYWVVLTAAIVGLGLAVLTNVSVGTTDLAGGKQNGCSGCSLQVGYLERVFWSGL